MSERNGSILTTPGLMSAFFKQHLDPWRVFLKMVSKSVFIDPMFDLSVI